MAAPLPDYEAPPDLVGVDEAIEVGRAQMAAERQQRARMMTAPAFPAVSLDDLSAEDIASRLRSNR